VETREFSITKQVDFTAKVFRAFLSPMIGPNVITDKLLKKVIRPTAQSALNAVIKEGIIANSSRVIDVRVDTDDPTVVNVDVDLVALYPLVRTRVTLYI